MLPEHRDAGLGYLIAVPTFLFYAVKLIVGETVPGGALIVTMARLDSIIAGGLARAGLVEVARPPVVWYHEREWHIVGAGQEAPLTY